MQRLVAKSICRLYALGIAALGVSIAMQFFGAAVAAGLLALAVGLATLQRWAFLPSYVIPILYAFESLADATRLHWLRPSRLMPGALDQRFRSNLFAYYFLDGPAMFLHWYGLPRDVAKILLCLLAVAALACAHRELQKTASLRRRIAPHDKAKFLRIMLAVSKAAVGLPLAIIIIAVWKDPPIGGSNPGGPGPGTSAFFSIVLAGPWLLVGVIGWAISARLLRRATPPT